MRTLVLGAGGTGGYFGGRLLEGGADVTFLVRPRRAEQLAGSGLRVKSKLGDLHLTQLSIAEKADRPYDLVIVSCKAYDLNSAIEAIRPAVGAGSTILPLLNGMGQINHLQSEFLQEKVLGGFCIISASLADDGTVLHHNESHTLKFGELSGEETPRIEAIKQIMQPTKIDWKASDNIERDMWEKWTMISSLAAATCLMRASIGQIARSPEGAKITEQLLDECLAIFRAHGHEPREEFVRSTRARSIDPSSTLKASMLRDLERGGEVEADHILGDLIARADSKNVPVPLLKVAYCHLKAYELRRDEEGL